MKIVDESDIPEDAMRMHLYDSKDVLMPRGSMKKESIGPYLLERLTSSFESWTDDKYGDNPTVPDLIKYLHSNFMGEVEQAWLGFMEAIISELPEIEQMFIKMSLMSITKPAVNSPYVKWFYKTIKSDPHVCVEAFWFIDQYNRNSPAFHYWTKLHVHYINHDKDYQVMFESAQEEDSPLAIAFAEDREKKARKHE